jgi:hypothetical protein
MDQVDGLEADLSGQGSITVTDNLAMSPGAEAGTVEVNTADRPAHDTTSTGRHRPMVKS